MSEALLRQWAMLQRIPRHPRKITAQELKTALEEAGYTTTVRTIQRDLKTLSAEFPLESDERAHPFGWCWAPGANLMDIPGMDGRTALTFKLVETYTKPLLPPTVLDFLEPYLKRADEILGALADSPLGAWTDRVRVVPRGMRLLAPSVRPEVLDVIYRALFEQKQFRALYVPRTEGGEDPREYVVNPLGLVFRDQLVYLVGTLWSYNDPKHLALHRFEKAELSEDKALPPSSFDFDEYVRTGVFDYPEGDTIKLKALFTSDAAYHLRETPLSGDQVIRPHDNNGVEVTASVGDTAQLRWWLMGFGHQVTVLSPPGLRAELTRAATLCAQNYATTGELSKEAQVTREVISSNGGEST
jgi:predicted DNA-binding transcriptional regulator YafY